MFSWVCEGCKYADPGREPNVATSGFSWDDLKHRTLPAQVEIPSMVA